MANIEGAGSGKVLREGSATKRAAILAAAKELFLSDGFDKSSVDAVAARAGVSKRTVYDYFGDKRALLVAVVAATAAFLLEDVRENIAANLLDFNSLEDALIAFSKQITRSTLGSSEYAQLLRLTSLESANLPEFSDHFDSTEPEDLLIERFDAFVGRGLLEARDTTLAVDHFIALTFMPAANVRRLNLPVDEDESTYKIVEGVRAFLRAYAAR